MPPILNRRIQKNVGTTGNFLPSSGQRYIVCLAALKTSKHMEKDREGHPFPVDRTDINSLVIGRHYHDKATERPHRGLDNPVFWTQPTVTSLMEFAVTPPRRVAAGVELHSPLVVTFSGSPSSSDDGQTNGEATLSDFSGMWIYLSLTTADMRETLAPPQSNLFSGRKADSIHQVHCEQDGTRPTVAYATFPDVVITRPGTYRLKVAVIDMNPACQGDTVQEAGRVLPCLHSPVFEVVEASHHCSYEDKVVKTIDRLRSIGIDC